MYIHVIEMKSNKMDILSSELFDISELKEFRLTLKNIKEQAEIISFEEWIVNQ